MIKFILLLLLINITIQAQLVTFNELMKSSTNSSIRLKMFKSDEDIQSSRIETIYNKYYPSLALSYNTEYNKDLDGLPSGSESIGDSVITSGTRYQSSLSLNLNYELYSFGVTEDSISIAKNELDIKRVAWCEEEKKLHQTILDRYSSALKSKLRSSIKKEMLEIHKELYVVKQRLYEAGKYSKLDLGDEAIDIIDLEREIELDVLQYQEDLIQLSSLSHVELDKDTTELLEIDADSNQHAMNEFEDTTLGLKYKKQLSQKIREMDMLNHSQYPTFSMYGNYYMYGTDSDNMYDSYDAMKKNSWKLGLAVRINLFEGFKYNNDSQTLKYELQRIKHERDLYKREYEYNAKMKKSKVSHLNTLVDKDKSLYNQISYKMIMVNRLRETLQVDNASELNTMLESLQRKLNLEIEISDKAYEKASLNILYKGINECTQH